MERWIALTALAVLFGLLAAFAIATRVSLLTTRGGSMEPLFSQGDLAITLQADDYKVGDIVAYRTEPNGYLVLHRIVRIADGRFTFKGDNNDFLDPDKPTKSKIVGRLAFRISGAGGITDWMTTKTRALLVILGAFLLVAGTGVAKRRRRRGRPGRDPSRGDAPARAPTVPPNLREVAAALGAPAVLVLVVAVLTAAAFSRPLVRPTTKKTSYTQTVSYDYRATAKAGATYPDGKVTTGMPIFTKLVSSVKLRTTYQLDAELPHDAHGTYSLDAEISAGGSWKQTVVLQPETAFTGTTFDTETTLDFDELREIVAGVKAETGAGSDALQILITPNVMVQGSVGPLVMSDRYSTPLKLALTPLELTFDSPENGPTIKDTKVSKLRVPTTKPQSITFLGRTMPVERGRTFGLIGLLCAGAWLVSSIRTFRREQHGREPEKINHKYHASIVEIRNLPPLADAVDVADMTMLSRLAERGEHLILHHHEAGHHTYLVDDTSTLYRYTTFDDAPDDAAEPESGPPTIEDDGLQATPPVEAPVEASVDASVDASVATPPPYLPTVPATPPPYVPFAAQTPPPYVPFVARTPPPYNPASDRTPPPYSPVTTFAEPQSLDDALRLSPVTEAESDEFGITNQPPDHNGCHTD